MTVPIAPDRMTVLSDLLDTLRTNLAASSDETVAAVKVTVQPLGENDSAQPNTIYVGTPTGQDFQVDGMPGSTVIDSWTVDLLVVAQPPGGAAAETQFFSTLTLTEQIVGIVVASVHSPSGRLQVASGPPRVAAYDGPSLFSAAPPQGRAAVTVTVTQTIDT